DVGAAWDVERLPAEPGRDAEQILTAARSGEIGGLVVGGLDPADLPDPAAARAALEAVGFLVSLEVRTSAVTELADVVLPVAPPVEKAGTFLNWEGRPRPFPQALTSTSMADHRVLDALADAMEVQLGLRTVTEVHAEIDQLGGWDGGRVAAPAVAAVEPPALEAGQAVLATWHLLLDAGRCQEGEAFLAGTSQRPVARVSPAHAQRLGITSGQGVTVRTAQGQVTLPVAVTPMADGVVWLPTNSVGSAVRRTLGADAGAVVEVAAASTVTTATTADDGGTL
ncbi:molybdopterin dinucleotide binding domain-containing protein, partial [Actinotalea sp. C106]|uniref:molybdopterin dinucleotide binding domain-containing protein n=1 Tax=Actinotalea sp. C106 TaxID=2908644 RepID=UPI00202874E6